MIYPSSQGMDLHEALITREHVKAAQPGKWAKELLEGKRISKLSIYTEMTPELLESPDFRDLTWLINHPANCVLRHHNTKWCWHAAGVGGDDIFELCAIQLVRYEGFDCVYNYLQEMAQLFPVNGKRQLQRFESMQWINS